MSGAETRACCSAKLCRITRVSLADDSTECFMIRYPLILAASLAGSLCACTRQHACAECGNPFPPTSPRRSPTAIDPMPTSSAMPIANRRETLEFAGVKPGDADRANCCPAAATSPASSARRSGAPGHVYALGAGAPGRRAGGHAGFCREGEGDCRGSRITPMSPWWLQPLGNARSARRRSTWSSPRRTTTTCTISRRRRGGVQQVGVRFLKPGGTLSGPGSCRGAGFGRAGYQDLAQDRCRAGEDGSHWRPASSSSAAATCWQMAADPRTRQRCSIPSIRGKTDQFILKFRKPKK